MQLQKEGRGRREDDRGEAQLGKGSRALREARAKGAERRVTGPLTALTQRETPHRVCAEDAGNRATGPPTARTELRARQPKGTNAHYAKESIGCAIAPS